jgi:diacylglycerol kinase (ATP)
LGEKYNKGKYLFKWLKMGFWPCPTLTLQLMARKFLLLYNPISGGGKSQKLLQTYNSFTELHKQFEFFTAQTDVLGKYDAVKALIQSQNISDVIIAGGDGTVNQVIYALNSLPVQFGIVPRGSGNGLALAAGIPKNVIKALHFIINNEQAKLTDAFMVNNSFACMLAGLGFDAQVAAEFALSNTRGFVTYAKLTIKNFIKAKAHKFELQTANGKVEVESFLTCVANSNQFGNHFTIAPKAILNDGLLDIVVVGKMNKLLFLLRTLKQVAGYNALMHNEKINSSKSILYFQASELTIKNLTGAPIHIDGETVSSSPEIQFKVLPNFFKLIRK